MEIYVVTYTSKCTDWPKIRSHPRPFGSDSIKNAGNIFTCSKFGLFGAAFRQSPIRILKVWLQFAGIFCNLGSAVCFVSCSKLLTYLRGRFLVMHSQTRIPKLNTSPGLSAGLPISCSGAIQSYRVSRWLMGLPPQSSCLTRCAYSKLQI